MKFVRPAPACQAAAACSGSIDWVTPICRPLVTSALDEIHQRGQRDVTRRRRGGERVVVGRLAIVAAVPITRSGVAGGRGRADTPARSPDHRTSYRRGHRRNTPAGLAAITAFHPDSASRSRVEGEPPYWRSSAHRHIRVSPT